MLTKRLLQAAMLLVVAVIIGNIRGDVSAQGGLDREEVRPFVRVTFGSRTDNYIYYTPDNPDYPRIVRILDKAIPIYSAMTGQPWTTQIVVVYMGNNSTSLSVMGRLLDNSTAYVTRREPAALFPDAQSCHIRMYDGWSSVPNLESLVARQFFHCVQMSLGAVGILDFGNPSYTWWLQGTAEWAASRVYPEQYPQPIHSVFDPRQEIKKARLDAFYLWEFLSSARGFGNDQNVIQQMGVMRTGGIFPFNYGLDSTELFHNWAQVLLNNQLPIPPILDLTMSDLTAGEGGNLQTSLPPFAVDYKNLISFDMKPGNIAFVQVSNISGSSYAVSARTANGLQRLVEGTPLQFCPADDGTMLILSHGLAEGPAPFTIEWGQVPSENPCTPDENKETDADACIVGSWQVVSFPVSVGLAGAANVNMDGFIFTFDEVGAMSGVYAASGTSGGNTVRVNVPFSGSYELGTAVDNTYEVISFDWVFDPGGSLTMTQADGTVSDFTTQFYANSQSTVPWSPTGTLICDETTLSWSASDGTGDFELSRLP